MTRQRKTERRGKEEDTHEGYDRGRDEVNKQNKCLGVVEKQGEGRGMKVLRGQRRGGRKVW